MKKEGERTGGGPIKEDVGWGGERREGGVREEEGEWEAVSGWWARSPWEAW